MSGSLWVWAPPVSEELMDWPKGRWSAVTDSDCMHSVMFECASTRKWLKQASWWPSLYGVNISDLSSAVCYAHFIVSSCHHLVQILETVLKWKFCAFDQCLPHLLRPRAPSLCFCYSFLVLVVKTGSMSFCSWPVSPSDALLGLAYYYYYYYFK